jgi:hypothetical protein
MLYHLRLENVGPANEMALNFAPRLNLITGDNGLGKSFLLDVAWWVLTRRWPAEVNPSVTSGLKARPARSGPASIEFSFLGKVRSDVHKSTFDRREETWKVPSTGRPPRPGLVLYAQVDGGFSVWDPARNSWKKLGNEVGPERRPAYVFSPREVWDGLKAGDVQVCNGLILDWALWQNQGGEAFHQLRSVLQTLSPAAHETLVPGDLTKLTLEDARWIPTLRMPYGQDVPVLQVSAAMKRVLALAYLLVWSWQEHLRASTLLDEPPTRQVTFLIDEMESHLHPIWQRTIVRSLLEVIRSLAGEASVQLLATTHSPLLLASVEPFFDPEKDAWFDLDLERTSGFDQVVLRKRPFVRQGEVSNWLTSEAFDLKSARSLEAERAIEKALDLLARQGKPSAEEVREVDGSLRSVLPELDRFWVRWSAFMEEHAGGER